MNTTATPAAVPAAPAPVLASAAQSIARRGLFAEQPLVVGAESQEWALWLTAVGQVVPMPSLGEALIEAAEHNAVAADLDDGSPFNAVVHAVVLHHGTAWRRPRQARTGSVHPHILFSAWCAICNEPLDEEYGYYESPEDVVAVARDHGWRTLAGGELVCAETDPAHLTAEQALTARTALAAEGQTALDLPADPDPVPADEPDGEYPVGRYLFGARLHRAPATAPTPPRRGRQRHRLPHPGLRAHQPPHRRGPPHRPGRSPRRCPGGDGRLPAQPRRVHRRRHRPPRLTPPRP
ncbi:hypothetical protein [Kitasatospora cheerisanensis]|uniref:Uncharacterized protein n=1 Tax=Kitasatospora cheerisanensis KCTC 2395 TaxID=1348663 RepID=A0A066YQY0_9ACTN|nr:hypothetical protein [Kitasatospora cheerisanensis]KDN80496.1 hypothetical protein KCH_77300 [Kitasatospora cheerisanensis KCTC 2395]